MKFRVLFKVSATLLLAAAILFCAVAAQAEQTEAEPVTGEFDREIYVFEAGKDVYMLVDLKNTKGLQASAAAELRLDDGVVLAKADIKAGDKRVKFSFTMPEGYEVKTMASVWLEGYSEALCECGIALIDKEYEGIRGNYERDDMMIAITFDCAYGETYTDYIVSTLDSYGICATWFPTGGWLKTHADYILDFEARGYEIGNHTQTHPRLPTLSAVKVYREINAVQERLIEIKGSPSKLFRPPYGAHSYTSDAIARYLGCEVILWAIDSSDSHADTSLTRILNRVLNNVKPGDIILFHNGAPLVTRYLEPILDELIARGYTFCTVSQLLKTPKVRPLKPRSFDSNRLGTAV